jgi:hypothetical protein
MRELSPSLHVVEHGGALNVDEVKRLGARSPALAVTCLGVPKNEVQGSRRLGDAVFAIFCVASSQERRPRDVVALNLAETVLEEVPNQFWSDTAAKAPTDVVATNLYSTSLDKLGVSMWAVRWRQRVLFERNVELSLDDFLTLHAEYDVGATADTEPTTDTITLEGPA